MRDLEALCGLGRILVCVDRAGRGWPFDIDGMAPEDQQVEVELARSPAPTAAPTGATLEGLEPAEQLERRDGGFAATDPDVERDGSIPEFWLIGDAPRRGRVQPRDAGDVDPRDLVQRNDRARQRLRGIADVGTKTDVGADGPAGAHRRHLTIR